METPEGELQMQVVPKSLLSWIWLRAARDAVDGVNWSNCRYCDKPMALGDVYRHGALYCSDSCNTMYNRTKPKRRGKKS